MASRNESMARHGGAPGNGSMLHTPLLYGVTGRSGPHSEAPSSTDRRYPPGLSPVGCCSIPLVDISISILILLLLNVESSF